MIVNGKEFVLKNTITLKQFLEENEYDILKTAVECNGEIIPKAVYHTILLKDTDHIEIVSFVGGG